MARVVKLVHYPVKGCAGVALSRAQVTWGGIAHDRSFMVIDEDGVFRSQRRDPRMAVVRPEITAGGCRLTLRAPGVEPVVVDVDEKSPRRPVSLFGKSYRGVDQGDDVAVWLSDVLGVACRLVRVPPEHDRVTGGETAGTCAYADASALLLAAESSVDGLNERILGRGGLPVPVGRFRPNVVVDGFGEPHAEDALRVCRIGGAEFGYATVAVRCVVTTVEQGTGARSGPEPLRTLATYRRVPDGGVAFGVLFAVTKPGTMAVGDEVVVTRWSSDTAA